ncbi:hypothetical protein BOTBODRAFT_483617 [Botryobasidium botryosum FD-172 SS1]|uniref:Uncharacterized protein n=1 Tax=Botryobasidium botryosum (strain FD-172 SS1) TaxID=930990 RepID=A0A067MTL6_BOTB1|nr:hypothetical protein BOTBODRAFT_483617 [Botryobasidium botryosum FD-172 SS1]
MHWVSRFLVMPAHAKCARMERRASRQMSEWRGRDAANGMRGECVEKMASAGGMKLEAWRTVAYSFRSAWPGCGYWTAGGSCCGFWLASNPGSHHTHWAYRARVENSPRTTHQMPRRDG